MHLADQPAMDWQPHDINYSTNCYHGSRRIAILGKVSSLGSIDTYHRRTTSRIGSL